MLEALLLSVATYVAISELIVSSGTLAPVALVGANETLTALVSAHTMEVLYMMDTIKTPADCMNLLLDKSTETDATEKERAHLKHAIKIITNDVFSDSSEDLSQTQCFIEKTHPTEEAETDAQKNTKLIKQLIAARKKEASQHEKPKGTSLDAPKEDEDNEGCNL